MPVSTIQSALGATGGINPESNKILGYLQGQRTAEQMIQEYFGLRKEVIYSDDGQEVVDMVNEFRDPEMLKKKKVCYKQYFASKGLTEEMFYRCVPREYVYVETPIAPVTNLVKDDQDTTSTGDTQEEPVISRPRGRAKKTTK